MMQVFFSIIHQIWLKQQIQIKLTFNIKITSIRLMFSEQAQQNSNIQARTRRAQIQLPKQPQQKINPRAIILQLGQKIKSAYQKLEQTYEQSSVKNQNYLLQIYVKILNEMMDEVVYAQEQVTTVDYTNLKQHKKIEYLTVMKKYRDECLNLKEKIDNKKNILKQQRKNTNNLVSSIQELEILCAKKQDELGLLKSYVSTKERSEKEKIREQKKRMVEPIIQIEESGEKEIDQCIKQSKAGHSTKNQSKMTFYQNNLTKQLKDEKKIKSKSSISTRLRQEITSQRQIITDNKYQSSNIEGRNLKSQGKHKQQSIHMSMSIKSKSEGKNKKIKEQNSKQGYKYKINFNEHDLHTERFQKLSSSLWLYKPTSFRKRKQKMSKQGTIYSNNTLQLLKNRIKGYSESLIECKKTTNILDQQMTQRLETSTFNSNI